MLIAEKIHYELSLPFKLDDRQLTISSSTGIATYPRHGSDETELAQHADVAMYYAKTNGC